MKSCASWYTFIMKNRTNKRKLRREQTVRQEKALNINLLVVENRFLFTRKSDFANIIVR